MTEESVMISIVMVINDDGLGACSTNFSPSHSKWGTDVATEDCECKGDSSCKVMLTKMYEVVDERSDT